MLRRILFALLGIVVVLVLAASWLGVAQIPVLSTIFGMDHARDLGMPSDRDAFEAFCDRWGIERPSDPANYTLSSKHHWSGSVQIDDTLTEAALGSIRELHNPNAHFSGVQIRIHDGYAEIAAFVNNIEGYPLSGPIYGKFSLTVTSPKSVSVQISQLEFGRVGVPGNVTDHVQNILAGYLNDKIVEAGITIEALELREGGIYFKGTWPQTITADPSNPGDLP